MVDEKKQPNWTIPAILSAALVGLLVLEPIVVAPGGSKALSVIIGLSYIMLSFISCWMWGAQIKLVDKFATPGRVGFRATLPFFITWAVLLIPFAINWILHGEKRVEATHLADLVVLFGILWMLLFMRGVLMVVVRKASGKGDAMKARVASGIADGIIIAGIALRAFLATHSFRFLILGVVFAGIRIGWGYVPEERLEIVQEFVQFLGERKLWWMTPIFLIMGLLVVLVLITESTGGSFPFIYAVF